MTGHDLEGWTGADWQRLRELRNAFLRAGEGYRPGAYWTSRRDLELYDATFARRIGWKWEAVLDELALRDALPRGGTWVDFGCGSGIATRSALGRGGSARRVHLVDRSQDAARFAAREIGARFPGVELELAAPPDGAPIDVLLASHVIDELDDAGRAALLALAKRSAAVVWVEAGSHAASRGLSAARDELLGEVAALEVVAPCTHRERCGALRTERDWCHLFAKPPAEAFTSAGWRRFAVELGLDLRSLPYSFVALRRSDAPSDGGGARVLGRPRILKGRAKLDVCDAGGLRELTLLQRTDKALFRRLEQPAGVPLVLDLEVEGERIGKATAREPRNGAE